MTKTTLPCLASSRLAGEPSILSASSALITASVRFEPKMAEAMTRTGQLTWQDDSDATTVIADPAAWGDVILARKETPTSYHLSVVVDDAAQAITHVVRGRDLYHATSVHRLLQALLGLPTPRYHHHRLIVDDGGRKLAKSDRDTALAELRAAGHTPADIRRMVGLPADQSG